MNNSLININPTTIIKTTTITVNSFKIQSITINFNDIAVVYCMIYGSLSGDASRSLLYERNLAIPVPYEIYSNWTYNSEFIIDFCKNYIENLTTL